MFDAILSKAGLKRLNASKNASEAAWRTALLSSVQGLTDGGDAGLEGPALSCFEIDERGTGNTGASGERLLAQTLFGASDAAGGGCKRRFHKSKMSNILLNVKYYTF
ncbi:MAG: hypothetical protein WA943_04375 [Parvibaculum sp.]